MIELVSVSRCIECNLCVKVCPTHVFDEVEGAAPVIARQSDCQTCFICEAYCPVDALYVAPFADRSVPVSEDDLEESGALGGWRATIGWGPGRTPIAKTDSTPLLESISPRRRG
ncbi:ferredoxin [Capsulimonas corticalis]|uniref:Ferredoxin n=1 Tax=Capsulimonas corticalis TaxID=2219043 RepID=A0A402CSF8_9BACT|nr:ferredoxin family protein [Capsulimonas corticalis]BDI31106.1 ferredoxin [Capsulimonas corticalis]